MSLPRIPSIIPSILVLGEGFVCSCALGSASLLSCVRLIRLSPVKMVSKNNAIFNSHFRKHWIRNVKTWFDQPANKLRRLKARKEKVPRSLTIFTLSSSLVLWIARN